MFYIKKKKAPIEKLNKTYTESEESKYSLNTVNVGLKGLIAIVTIFCGVTAVSACPSAIRLSECYWDGAGNKWKCGNCGESNYDWQNSCSNCGES